MHRSLKRVTVSYVYYFNHKYKRTGHLFQDRFKSERIEDDSYLISCTRYIHNNPVKTGLALRAEQYKWSSFGQYISSDRDSILKVNREFVLDLYSQDIKKAVMYFLKDSDNECQNDFLEYNDTRAESHRKSWDEICGDIRKQYGFGINEIKGIENKALRNEVIKGIKENSELSLNEFSEKIGLSKYIICRA